MLLLLLLLLLLLPSLGAQALRCLALAYKSVPQASSSSLSPLDEAGLTFIAMVAMHDPPRRECAAAIQMCRQVGSRGPWSLAGLVRTD
jgi:magnesium-transporting ATPase (P-type)